MDIVTCAWNQVKKIFVPFLLLLKVDILNYQYRDQESANKYLEKISGIQASFAANLVLDMNPSCIIEIGSNCGPNLFTLRNLNSDLELIGLDINNEACRIGNEYSLNTNSRVKFSVFNLAEVEKLQDVFKQDKPDTVLSFATLLLIPPKHIKRLLQVLITNSKNLVIIETMNFGIFSRLFIKGFPSVAQPFWLRDYIFLIEKIVKELKISAQYEKGLVPKEVWNPGAGTGYYVKIRLEKSEGLSPRKKQIDKF
jgi:hypothetical protein